MKSILALFITVSLYSMTLTEEFFRMSAVQQDVLKQAHHIGGYTLAGQVWQESQAGKYRVGLNTNGSADLGVAHINSSSFLTRWYKEHPKHLRSPFYDNILLSKLMIDDEFNLSYAMKERNYWKVKRGRDPEDVIKSYNCGNNIKRQRCVNYLKVIQDKTMVLILHLQVTGGRYEVENTQNP